MGLTTRRFSLNLCGFNFITGAIYTVPQYRRLYAMKIGSEAATNQMYRELGAKSVTTYIETFAIQWQFRLGWKDLQMNAFIKVKTAPNCKDDDVPSRENQITRTRF